MQSPVCELQALFKQQGFIHLAYKIITFIDLQTLLHAISQQQTQKKLFKHTSSANTQQSFTPHSNIKRMIQAHYFFKQFLNKSDRSMYFSFYEEPEFISISNQLEENIVIAEGRNSLAKTSFAANYCHVMQVIDRSKNQELLTEEEIQELKRILVDPSLPLPSLKRENEGMYCNSSFQLFLVGLRFPHYGEESYTAFSQFQQKLQLEQGCNFKQFLEIQKEKQSFMKKYQNLHLVRYMPYEISFEKNYTELLLEDNSQHNLIVTVFAITDVWIEAIFSMVNAIDDPFYKFIQLLARYSVFRSFVMQLQDSLGFVFSTYENLYADTIKDSIFVSSPLKPKFYFWRSALAKWFVKMDPIHSQTNKVYFLLLTKLRQQDILNNLDPQNPDLAWKSLRKYSMCFKNSLQMNLYSDEIRDDLYSLMKGSSMVEQFLSKNQETCEALVFEYVEYFTDLAVNQETVHWCGHSRHKLQKPFNVFTNQFHLYNTNFVENIKQKVLTTIPSLQSRKSFLQLLIQRDLEFLQSKNLKPVIMRQIVEDINLNQKFFQDLMDTKMEKKIKDLVKSIQEDQMMNSISQKLIGEQLVVFDFTEKDEKLKYFNQKAKICEEIEGEQKCFFSIPPMLSPQQILTKSINTNDTSQNQQREDESSLEYISESDSDHQEAQMKQKPKHQYQKQEFSKSQQDKQHKTKKVQFQQQGEDETEMENSAKINSEKKTLDSTNSSAKNSPLLTTNGQNEQIILTLQAQIQRGIIKSKSM